MKKIGILTIILILLTSCVSKDNNDKVQISASIYPLAFFAEQIGGDHVEVFNVLSQGGDAHDYEPSVKDRIKIENSDLFVYNGFHLEHWVDKTLESVSKEAMVIVETSQRIEPIMRETHADPHIWLDPFSSLIQAENIYNALISIDKGNKVDYDRNFEVLKNKFIALQDAYDTTLTVYKGDEVVLEHEIFSYIAERYQFKQISISGIFPEGEPSIQQLQKLIKYIKENKISSLLFSKYNSEKVVKTLVEETGIQILLIDSMEIGNEDFDYFNIMYSNLNMIKEALSNE